MNKIKSDYVKLSDRFWRNHFMNVLKCWYYEDCTWNIDKWKNYGISEGDRKKIEREFFRQLEKKK